MVNWCSAVLELAAQRVVTNMVAVSRNCGSRFLASLDEGSPLLNHDLLAIDGDFDLSSLPRCCSKAATSSIVGKNSASGGVQAPQKTLPHHGVELREGDEPEVGRGGGRGG